MTFTCPGAVAQFLLAERRLHQRNGEMLESMSVLEKASFAVEMMQDWDRKYAELENTVHQANPCDALGEFILRTYTKPKL